MINAGVLTFREFAMREPLPLSTVHEAVLEFLQGREDAVLFGAQAVNAYVAEPRMTQDVGLLSTRAAELADELREHLSQKFHVAVRVREIADGKGFRIYQTRKEGNRHLVDVRLVSEFPATEIVEKIRVLSPAELIASKIVSFQSRYGKSKSWTDRRDITVLLLQFPELKKEIGEVGEILRKSAAGEKILDVWREIVAQDLQIENDDEDLTF